ncbi:MAG: glycoside hydrolase family 30 protein [Oscillospiraceae bacterium]|nr:glycoside hydrolase family 30 protein [Oscillospiraceae bacterium]
MKVSVTKTNLQNQQYWQENSLQVIEGFKENDSICLYPQIKDQVFYGFGGAFTEASAFNWKKLSDLAKKDLMESYFGTTGLCYTLGRTHINSCDFSLENYACMEDEQDENLMSFQTLRDEQYIMPMIQAAQQVAGAPIELMLSPWSPPSFMKTNGKMTNGGKLKPEYGKRWAQCIARYVKAYQDKGFCIKNITVQNEPDAVQPWDSCIYTAEEETQFAINFLLPALQKAITQPVDVFIWDHNKDQLVTRLLNSTAALSQDGVIAGAAFHWYSGDHFEAVDMVHRLYPNIKLYFTEGCVEYSRFDGMTLLEKAEMYAHDIIGNLNAGTNAILDWNLLLDEKGGPNYVGNFCESPIMCSMGEDTIEKKASYYYIGQFSRFIQPNSKRIGVSTCCKEIEATAFQNLDCSIALILLNTSSNDKSLHVRLNENSFTDLTVYAHEIATLKIIP